MRSGIAGHYVSAPHASTDRFNILVLFLGGSLSSTSDYTGVSDEAAGLGYGVIDLDYPNNKVVGTTCSNDDACFRNFRGEVNYGKGVHYTASSPAFDAGSSAGNVGLSDSIVNRFISLLDYLAYQTPSSQTIPDPSFWSQFLITDSSSPYSTQPHTVTVNGTPTTIPARGVYPDWSKIIIAGHSQGGGHAAFMGVVGPIPIRRVILFSAPNDNDTSPSPAAPPGTPSPCCTAGWMAPSPAASGTPLQQFWGMRTENEGSFGDFTATNWTNMGGYGSGGVGLTPLGGTPITNVDGSEFAPGTANATSGKQRIVLKQVSTLSTFSNHNNSAVYNDNIHTRTPATVAPAWDYLLTGGYTEQYH